MERIKRIGSTRKRVIIGAGEELIVRRGETLQAVVQVEGSLAIEHGGRVQGTVGTTLDGHIQVDGVLEGGMAILGAMTVGARGKAVGTLKNNGTVTVAGLIGGEISGRPIVFVQGGRQLELQVRNGTLYVSE